MGALERRVERLEARPWRPCLDPWHATVRPRLLREPPDVDLPPQDEPEGPEACPTCGEVRPVIVIEYSGWPPGGEAA